MIKYLINLLVFNKFLTLLGVLLVWKYEVGNPARLLVYRGEPMVYANFEREELSKSERLLNRIRPLIIIGLIAIIVLLIALTLTFFSTFGWWSILCLLPILSLGRTLYECCFGST